MTKANSVNPLQSQRGAGSTEEHYPGHIRIVYLSAFWLLISVLLVYFGVRYGPQVLSLLKSEGAVNLQTMGELLGGALGVTVAFAGAWVAYKVASFAFEALEMQETREALETANETLEESIGTILRIQADCERLLRHTQGLQEIVDDRESRSYSGDAKRPFKEEFQIQADVMRKEVGQDAQRLAKSIKALLSNPLALSVVFALQRMRGAPDFQILQELSQAPRWLANLASCVGKENLYDRPFNRRWVSPFDAGLRLVRYRRSFLEEALSGSGASQGWETEKERDALHGALALEGLAMEEEAMKLLSYLTHLTSECSESSFFDIHEPHLIALLRCFTYTPGEAQEALRQLFDSIYGSPRICNLMLETGSAWAFCNAGRSNDVLSGYQLRISQGITQRLSNVLQQPSAVVPTLRATVRMLGIVNPSVRTYASARIRWWEGEDRARRLKLLMQWSGEWSVEKARNTKQVYFKPEQRALVDKRCYDKIVIQPLLKMLADEMQGSLAYETCGIMLQEYEPYKQFYQEPDSGAEWIICRMSNCLRRARIARAEWQLQKRIEEVVEQKRLPLAGLAPGDGSEGLRAEIRQVIREEAAKLCRLAEEAVALKELSKCEIPGRENVGEENVRMPIGHIFTKLRNELNRRLVDRSLSRAADREKKEICQCIEEDNLWPALVSRICFILGLESDGVPMEPLPARFRSVSESLWMPGRPPKDVTRAFAQVCLHHLLSLGAKECHLEHGDDFAEIVCGLPVDVADQVTVNARFSLRKVKCDNCNVVDETAVSGEMAVSVCFEVQGKSHHDDDDAALQAALQAHFLGYANGSPEFPRPFHFTKTIPFGGAATKPLEVDAILLELKLIAQTYAAGPR